MLTNLPNVLNSIEIAISDLENSKNEETDQLLVFKDRNLVKI